MARNRNTDSAAGLRLSQAPRHRQEILQRVPVQAPEACQDDGVGSIVVGDVVGIGSLGQQILPIFGRGPDDQRFRTGDPSYFVLAATSANVSPRASTRSKARPLIPSPPR